MQFDPALSSVFYRFKSQLVSCPSGVTRLLLSDPNRVYARFEYVGLPVLTPYTILYGGGGVGGSFGLLSPGTPIEIKWVYHGPLCGQDWYLNNSGVGSIDVLTTEICYNAR